MEAFKEFERCIAHLCEGLGHAYDRAQRDHQNVHQFVPLRAFDPWVGHSSQVFQQACPCTHQLSCSKNREGYSFLTSGATACILAINLGAIALASLP